MTSLDDAIRGMYAQVAAPAWAAPNLDALADVLRDLSWLPAGPVELRMPDLDDLDEVDGLRLLAVVLQAAAETEKSPRAVRLSGEVPPAGRP